MKKDLWIGVLWLAVAAAVISVVSDWPWGHTFSTYTWPGPFGWVATNTPANVVAGFLQIGIGFALGYGAKRLGLFERVKTWFTKDVHEHVAELEAYTHTELDRAADHRKWEAEALATLHVKITGNPIAPHPEHGDLSSGS